MARIITDQRPIPTLRVLGTDLGPVEVVAEKPARALDNGTLILAQVVETGEWVSWYCTGADIFSGHYYLDDYAAAQRDFTVRY